MRVRHLALVAATVVFAGCNVPVHAQGSLADQLSVCARIGKQDARLECFDSIAEAARQGGGGSAPSSAPVPQTARPAAPATASPSDFGAEAIKSPVGRQDNEETGEVTAAIAAARDNGLGMWQFDLTDGAVWRMTERVANFRPPAPNESVTIRKAALGSYLMQVGRQASVRVTRVR